MSKTSTLLVLAVLAIGGFAAWQFTGPATDRAPAMTDDVIGPEVEVAESNDLAATASNATFDETQASREDNATASKAKRVRVFGILVDERGAAVANQPVELRVQKGRFAFRFGWQGKRTKPDAVTKSSRAGRFEFRVPTGKGGSILLGTKEIVFAKPAPLFGATTADVDLGKIRTHAASTLAGVVHDARERPLADVRIQIWRRSGYVWVQPTKTDSKGRFAFAGLEPGSYSLFATSSHHLSKQQQITLKTSEERSDLDIELADGEAVSGRIVDDLGNPIAKAKVWAWSHSKPTRGRGIVVKGQTSSAQTESNAQGFFTFAGVRDGAFNVTASKKGYVQANTNSTNLEGGALILTLERKGKIAGIVVDENGEPVKGSSVWAGAAGPQDYESIIVSGDFTRHVGGGRQGSAKTGDDGRFVLENITPGKLEVHAKGQHMPAKTTGVIVEAGQETKGVRLLALRGVRMVVTVSGGDGKPVEGANVTARTPPVAGAKPRPRYDTGLESAMIRELKIAANGAMRVAASRPGSRSGRHLGSGRTDAEGRVTLHGLPPNTTIEVRATHEDWVASPKRKVVLPAKGQVETKLGLQRGGMIEVLSIDSAGAPLANQSFRIARIDANGQAKHVKSGHTDAVGRAGLGPLEPGRYEAKLMKPHKDLTGASFGPYIRTAGGPLDTTRVELRVDRGATASAKLVLPILTHMTGTVMTAAGPLAKARISLFRLGAARARSVASTKSKPNGGYELDNLEAGSYCAAIIPFGLGTPLMVRVEIPANMKQLRQDLMPSGGSIDIEAAESGGKGVAKARVVLRLEGTADAALSPLVATRFRNSVSSFRADGRGHAKADNILPGTYKLTISSNGYATTVDTLVVAEAGVTHKRITLRPGAEIRVTVLEANGKKPEFARVRYRADGQTNPKMSWARQGETTLRGLEPGIWFLQASKYGRAATWSPEQRIEVRAGTPARTTLSLTK